MCVISNSLMHQHTVGDPVGGFHDHRLLVRFERTPVFNYVLQNGKTPELMHMLSELEKMT